MAVEALATHVICELHICIICVEYPVSLISGDEKGKFATWGTTELSLCSRVTEKCRIFLGADAKFASAFGGKLASVMMIATAIYIKTRVSIFDFGMFKEGFSAKNVCQECAIGRLR